ncbi:hypothetical protein TNCV_447471 [Trichonephila clavipes]|nr:hypothetical protein TNCV_447471 [Trichonephila clavipes]
MIRSREKFTDLESSKSCNSEEKWGCTKTGCGDPFLEESLRSAKRKTLAGSVGEKCIRAPALCQHRPGRSVAAQDVSQHL